MHKILALGWRHYLSNNDDIENRDIGVPFDTTGVMVINQCIVYSLIHSPISRNRTLHAFSQ